MAAGRGSKYAAAAAAHDAVVVVIVVVVVVVGGGGGVFVAAVFVIALVVAEAVVYFKTACASIKKIGNGNMVDRQVHTLLKKVILLRENLGSTSLEYTDKSKSG